MGRRYGVVYISTTIDAMRTCLRKRMITFRTLHGTQALTWLAPTVGSSLTTLPVFSQSAKKRGKLPSYIKRIPLHMQNVTKNNPVLKQWVPTITCQRTS
jgi:hypothetical protein